MKKFFKYIKFIIIIVLVILIGGITITKCSNCKKENETAVAYAAEDISLYSTNFNYFDFKGNITNLPYVNISGENTSSEGFVSLCYSIFSDLPLNSVLTCEVISLYSNTEIVVRSVLYYGNSQEVWFNYFYDINNGKGYFTIDLSEYSNVQKLEVNVYYRDGYSGIQKYDFNYYFYYGSYVPGYGQGLAAGVQQGYNQGVNDSQYGAFKGATVDITQDFDGKKPNQTFKNLIPNYVYQGINSLNLDGYYDDPLELEDLYKCTFTINFAEPWTYDQNKNRLFFSGDLIGLTEYVTITTPDNVYYSFDITYEPQRGAVLNDKINPILISEIEFTVGRPSDLGRWWLTSVNTGTADYNYGYNQGYDAGLTAGKGNGYDAGYNTGFKEGESQGYANAVSEGASAMGLFTGAVSFVKVFFQLLTKLLETKIAGDISMGLLVVGLPAAFMIVNLAIGLVKKLLGARGASEGGDDS